MTYMSMHCCQTNTFVIKIIQDEIGDYSCSCETGWSGRNCDDNINDCTPTSCMNGGTCNVT